jgi:hypothetical protein
MVFGITHMPAFIFFQDGKESLDRCHTMKLFSAQFIPDIVDINGFEKRVWDGVVDVLEDELRWYT